MALLSFLASRFTTVVLLGQSAGRYDHYFEAIPIAMAILLIHNYFGFFTSGGFRGSGSIRATLYARRTSLVVVVSVALLISLAIYGSQGRFTLCGLAPCDIRGFRSPSTSDS
ncbi:hypothetical protein H7H98_11655 [Mycolicibacterium sphagni]|nr:hypothetical protein [Mycolicibacterium sphagni]